MFIDKGDYLELKEFLEHGVRVTYSTVKAGDLKKCESVEKAVLDLDIKNKKVYMGRQTHSNNVTKIDEKTKILVENCDGFITDRDDVAILSRYADCLPIYFLDTNSGAFGCIHSGWLGSYNKIVVEAIEMLKREYEIDVENLLVAFGIGISQKNYEVGVEFLEKFENRFSEDELKDVFFIKNKKIYFDNQRFNYNIMIKKGILNKNIIRNNLCTFEDKRFHSYRRDKDKSGRNGSFMFKIDKK